MMRMKIEPLIDGSFWDFTEMFLVPRPGSEEYPNFYHVGLPTEKDLISWFINPINYSCTVSKAVAEVSKIGNL